MNGALQVYGVLTGHLSGILHVSGSLSVPSGDYREPYEGDYTITPTQEEQVLPTNGKYLLNNLTINPIPNNYGLITWNGSVLTVS